MDCDGLLDSDAVPGTHAVVADGSSESSAVLLDSPDVLPPPPAVGTSSGSLPRLENSHNKRSTKRAGRALRQRRRKIKQARLEAERALHNFILAGGRAAAAAATQRGSVSSPPAEEASQRDPLAAGNDSEIRRNDRTRVLPAVAQLRQQMMMQQQDDDGEAPDSHGCRWSRRIEVELAGQLGYVPGNAVRVSCFQSQVECLHRAVGGADDSNSSSREGGGSTTNKNPGASTPTTIPVAIELYPLAVRYDTTTTTTTATIAASSSYKHGKGRTRRIHKAKGTTTTASTSGAGSDDVPSSSNQEVVGDDDLTDNGAVLEPFPTLYWLTHPLLRVLVSQLEVEGWGQQMEGRLRADPTAQAAMRAAHAKYGAYRYALLTDQDRQLLRQRNWESALSAAGRGVAGIRIAAPDGKEDPAASSSSVSQAGCCAVKCLHAHAAHFLSANIPVRESIGSSSGGGGGGISSPLSARCATLLDNGGQDNIVGRWVMELIRERILSSRQEEDQAAEGKEEDTGGPLL